MRGTLQPKSRFHSSDPSRVYQNFDSHLDLLLLIATRLNILSLVLGSATPGLSLAIHGLLELLSPEKHIYIYDHVRRFSLIWCTTTFLFSFTFYGYILRKLRKNDRHDVSIVIEEDEEDSEINGWRSRWRRSTRHSGKSREDRLIRRPLLRGSFETTIWQQLLALGHHARSNFLFVYLGLTFHV